MRQDTEVLKAAFRRAWNADVPASDSWDAEAALARTRARDLTRETLVLHTPRRAHGRYIEALVAASIVAVAAILGVWRLAQPNVIAPGTIVETGAGERRMVRLVDGTSVTLGPRSRLTLVPTPASERAASVDGDAYFRVARDSARPFSVTTGHAVIRVIGTEFAVRTYAEDSTTRVAVLEGRVAMTAAGAVGSARQTVELAAGDLGALVRGSTSIRRTRGANLTAAVSWTRGVLAFAETPLREVTDQLGRWYGVTFSIEPSLTIRPVTASFTDRPLAEVLAGICGAIRARCDQQGSHVTVATQ
jgi:transmembrane sensor